MSDSSLNTDALLDGLDPTQFAAVSSAHNPLAILAGAGSGKTRVLTRRIAHRVATGAIDPQRTLSVTFTRKAASELRTRLRGLGLRDNITTGTFHSLAYAQLRERWAEKGVRPPDMLDRKFAMIAKLLGRRANTSMILDTLHELEWITARNLSLERYPHEIDRLDRKPPIATADIIQTAKRYAEEKRNQRVIDFDDLLSLAIRDIEADPEYASVIHWRHRHLFVDEFQDVNPLQFRLLKAWIGPEPDLCVVGDPNQAIYAWNGADSWYLRKFTQHFPNAGVIKLGHNYRSTPEIIAAGHSVLPKPDREAEPPQTDRPTGPAPAITICDDDAAEAITVARAVRDHAGPGISWSQQAVLVRTNAQVAIIASAFERARIPHRVRGRSNLIDQPEIKVLLRLLRESTGELISVIPDIRAAVDETAVENEGAETAAEAERQRNREALLQLTIDHAASFPTANGYDFAGWLRASAAREGLDVGANAVDILTFHAAKGLEWNIVHLAGIESGYVPIAQANGPAALSEERRLLHVGLTRARDEVLITWAARRTFGERTSRRQRSPYLDHVDGTDKAPVLKLEEESGKARGRRHLNSIRAEYKDSEPDSPLYLELKKWRSDTAREQGVPAYIVFNNRTMAALAAAHPTTHDELLEVAGLGAAKIEKYGDELLALMTTR